MQEAAEQFHQLHERRAGHAMRERPIEAVLLRARATSVRPEPELRVAPAERAGPLEARGTVQAALGGESSQCAAAALFDREQLQPGDQVDGPALVAQLDTTTVVPPGWRARVDHELNMILATGDA
jgi:N-methylhydantoinase A